MELKKVKLYTLGCKVNQYETQQIAENLIKHGFSVTHDDGEADAFVVNSCTVTSESDRKTRQLVRHLKRQNGNSVVLLTGCMPQAFPEDARRLDSADIVMGNRNNSDIPARLKEYFENRQRIVDVREHLKGELFCGEPVNSFSDRTRAIIKIEDGCDRFCSYCIIPSSKGRVRSKPLSVIKCEAQTLADNGYCEVVLVGINLSAYGKDTGESFCDAVKTVCEIPGIKRVRLGSLEPDHITDEVIDGLTQLPKLCPQFHISLQSGCNNTLKRMNRHYTAEEYYELCRKLRARFKDCTLTTDIMVGFSGESEKDFLETLSFAESVRFEKIHIFPYSLRKGTRAYDFPDRVENSVKEERASRLNDTARKIRTEFLKNQIGKTVSVLPEAKQKDGYYFGYTANYTPVKLTGDDIIVGEIINAEIYDSDSEYCYAEIKGV